MGKLGENLNRLHLCKREKHRADFFNFISVCMTYCLIRSEIILGCSVAIRLFLCQFEGWSS